MRSSLFSPLALVVAFVTACSGAPGDGNGGDGDGTMGPDGGVTSPGRGSDGGASVKDPGVTPTEKVTITKPSQVFDSAGAYVAKGPAFNANSKHPTQVGGVQGKVCLSCHDGKGAAPHFAFAGTVYKGEGANDAKGHPSVRTKPAKNAHLRIVGSDGLVFDTWSDDDGNFWFKSPVDVKMPAFSGARSANGSAFGNLNGPSCAECHTPKTAPEPGLLWIY